MRTSKRYAMTSYLQNVNVLNLINSVQSCEEKTSVLEDNMRFSLDAIMPLESKTVISNKSEWITESSNESSNKKALISPESSNKKTTEGFK